MFINRLEVETVAVALLIVEQGGILNNYMCLFNLMIPSLHFIQIFVV